MTRWTAILLHYDFVSNRPGTVILDYGKKVECLEPNGSWRSRRTGGILDGLRCRLDNCVNDSDGAAQEAFERRRWASGLDVEDACSLTSRVESFFNRCRSNSREGQDQRDGEGGRGLMHQPPRFADRKTAPTQEKQV